MSESSFEEKTVDDGSCERVVEHRKGSIAEGELEILGYKQELHRKRYVPKPF